MHRLSFSSLALSHCAPPEGVVIGDLVIRHFFDPSAVLSHRSRSTLCPLSTVHCPHSGLITDFALITGHSQTGGSCALAATSLTVCAVSSELPFISIIIPTRPGQGEPGALSAARRLDYPRDRLEILLARGRQPSVQRNAAVKAAQGDLI